MFSDLAYEPLFRQMLAGNEETFFKQYWRKKPLLVKNALANCDYGIPRFWREIEGVEGITFNTRRAVDGAIKVRQTNSLKEAQQDVKNGACLMLNLLQVAESNKTVFDVEFLKWCRGLFTYVHTYLKPPISLDGSSCTIVFSRKDSCVGAHYDQVDNFYLNFHGRKHWQIGKKPCSPEERIWFEKERQKGKEFELKFAEDPFDFELGPGDALYIPPMTTHRVVALEDALSVAVCLESMSEVQLFHIMVTQYLRKVNCDYYPTPFFPKHVDLNDWNAAQKETRQRIQTLAKRMLQEFS